MLKNRKIESWNSTKVQNINSGSSKRPSASFRLSGVPLATPRELKHEVPQFQSIENDIEDFRHTATDFSKYCAPCVLRCGSACDETFVQNIKSRHNSSCFFGNSIICLVQGHIAQDCPNVVKPNQLKHACRWRFYSWYVDKRSLGCIELQQTSMAAKNITDIRTLCRWRLRVGIFRNIEKILPVLWEGNGCKKYQ